MTVSITRTHEFCYGHRVCGHEGKCKNLHGHAGVVAFKVVAIESKLDVIGRVIDFSVIKSRLCQWLEDEWDHRMLLWEHDPILEAVRKIDSTVVAVPFNPTAENLAMHLVENVGPRALAGTNVLLIAATFQETAKCSATYVRRAKDRN